METLKDIERVKEQLLVIEKAVYNFSSLDDALTGKGGDAIRAFYKECHRPFLEFFQESLTEFSEVLTQMANAVESFEANSDGYVDENYLESDVLDGLDKVEETTTRLTDEANSIIESVQDLVTVDKIDESDVMESVQQGRVKTNEVIEELHALDDAQVEALGPVREKLSTMNQYVTELESMFTKGDLSIDTYNSSMIQLNSGYVEMLSHTDPLKAIELKIENAVSYIAPYLAMLYPQVLLPLTYRHHEISQVPLSFASIKENVAVGFEQLTNEEFDQIAQSEIHINPDDTEEDIQLKEYLLKLQNGEVDSEYSISNYNYPDSSDYGEITVWDKEKVVGGLNQAGRGFGSKESEKALIKGIADFLILDDINTIKDKDESWINKTIAVLSLVPPGKVLKIAKLGKFSNSAKAGSKSNNGKIIKVADMDEFFATKLGKSIKNSLSKTKRRYDGQTIYKVEKRTGHLKKVTEYISMPCTRIIWKSLINKGKLSLF